MTQDPNRRFGPQGSTALLWASFYGDVFLVLRLLQEGADVNLADGLGRAPLWAAAVNNHVDVAQLLLEHGADVGRVELGNLYYLAGEMEPAGREWKTALAAAAEFGAASAVQHLQDCLAVLESEDLTERVRLTESLKERSG